MTIPPYEGLCIDDGIVLPGLQTDDEGMPMPRLVRSKRGLDMAVPTGEVIDYTFFRSELIRLGIFTFKIAGVWAYDNPKKPFRLKPGQRIATRREPDNPHDRNAVALTIGKEKTHIGYVAKGKAYKVAPELDRGVHLVGIITQVEHPHYPQALLTTPEILRHLRRR